MSTHQSLSTIVVFGGAGLLGHQLVADLRRSGHPVIAFGRPGHKGCDAEIDAATAAESRITSLLSDIDAPTLMVNAIGFRRDMHADEHATHEMIAVNALWPHRLAAAAATLDKSLVHISTDAVFPALTGRVDETSKPMPDELYGCSKFLGEPASPWTISLRCSFVGPGPSRSHGLWNWLIDQPPGAEIPGFEDQQWTGVTARQLVRLIARIAEPGIFPRLRAEGSVHHVCPNPTVSKLELVTMLAHVLRPDISVRRALSGRPITRRLATCRSATSLIADAGSTTWEAVIHDAVLNC